MVGETVRQNLSDRVGTVRTLGGGIAGDLRSIFGDVKGRIVDGAEPQFSKNFPNLGRVGSLVEEPIAFTISTADHIERFVQENARITRRWIGRARSGAF